MRVMSVSCIHTMIARQAALSPDRTAVVFANRSVSYAELDRRSRALARTLRIRGVGPRSLVGLHIDRSPEMIVGLLAVLRAGAAYVPLDPSFPEDRIDYMISDAGLRVIVTEPQFAQRLGGGGLDLAFVDATSPSTPELAGETFDDHESDADDIAYVIYTSGSTGRPKGVEVTHGGVVNFLESMQQAPGCTSDDVLLAVTTLSFDIAVLELLLPLVTGARVVIASRSAATDGRALAQMLAHEHVTIMQATPSTWRLLIEAGWSGSPRLKVLCGGEALPRNLANELLDRCGELWNMYGPTETTIWSAVERITAREGAISIGGPIANTTLHVLDSNMQRVPDGDAGELYIGGAGLARGYLNRPELTSQRFVSDPYSDDPGARMYRTGDLVRRTAEGALEFLGRVDHQVKVSGYRIELGEIEAVLEEHPAIGQAVVTAKQRGGEGDQRLVAYVVLKARLANLNSVLRAHVRQKLPAYMVPALFVQLDAFARTPNGKVDRGALPEPQWAAAFDAGGQVGPRTDIERDLAEIWARVLKVPSIGVTDSFFDLGASSLDGARLLAEMETRFGNRLPLGALFQAPTIEKFAALLGAPAPGSGRTSLVPLQPLGSKRPLFCVHGGAGTIYLFHPLAQRLGRDQPLFAFQARGLYGRDCPHRQVEEMAAHYIEEMRAVQPSGPYAISGYCFGGIVAYEMARQLTAAGEQIALLALFNAPNYLYYSEQGGDQRMFAPDDGTPDGTRAPAGSGMLLKRAYWFLAKELRTRSTLKRLGWRAVRAARLPVPAAMRDYYFRLNSWKAERDYVPHPYAGRMILFRAERLERDPLLGWGTLVLGGIESHAVAANQRTREIMEEPWVGGVSSVLSRHLNQPTRATPAAAPVRVLAADSV